MSGKKWLVSLLVVLQGISVAHRVNAECLFGSAADEGSPQMMGGQYADLQNPLPCSGYIVAWHLCFYTENVVSNTVYTAYFRVYRSEDEDRLLRIHEVQKSLQLSPGIRNDGSFICIDDALEEDQYLNVSQDDILAAYIPLTSPSLLIVGTNTPASFDLYEDTRNPSLSLIFVDVSMQDLEKVENSALHLYAEVATSDQLMPSVQPSTVFIHDVLSPSTAQPPSAVQSIWPSTNPSSSPSTSPSSGSETLILPAIIGAVAGVLGIIVVAIIITVVVVVICIASPWRSKAVSTTPETKRGAQEEPYYDYIQEENTAKRSHPLSPIDTSIIIAYGTAQDSGYHTQQLNAGEQPLSFTINMAYGAVDFSV